MYAPRHQVKFLIRVNLPGNKPVSDSDFEYAVVEGAVQWRTSIYVQ